MTDVAVRFAELFRGRAHAVGNADTKRSLRMHGPAYADVPEPEEWQSYVVAHLSGGMPLGSYCRRADGTVGWGCVDWDEGDEPSWVHARNVQLVLEEFGIDGWIERSRSKGFHLWVFTTEPVDGRLMREALLGACQVVGAPTKEINPKNVESDPVESLGNYVRLPYPGMLGRNDLWSTDARQVVLDSDGIPLVVEDFVQQAYDLRTHPSALEPLAALYEPPKRYDPPPPPPRPAGAGDPRRELSGLAYTIYKDGPLESAGRGHTLFRLARLMREEGKLSFSEAYEILADADARWGKFQKRGADGARQLRTVLDRAWS